MKYEYSPSQKKKKRVSDCIKKKSMIQPYVVYKKSLNINIGRKKKRMDVERYVTQTLISWNDYSNISEQGIVSVI